MAIGGEAVTLRSFFGAIEDWNKAMVGDIKEGFIAIVLRGDRGLEQKTPLRT